MNIVHGVAQLVDGSTCEIKQTDNPVTNAPSMCLVSTYFPKVYMLRLILRVIQKKKRKIKINK